MRQLRALGIYIAVVFLGGALLAPWLDRLAQPFAQTFPQIANIPFHRFVDRALLGLALIGLWPLLKSLGATSLRDLGLVPPAGQWNKLGGGLLLGFLSLALLAGFALASGARHVFHSLDAATLAEKLGSAMLTAVIVAVLEEILFRGALFGSLRKEVHWVPALAISSMIYAIVHFMDPHVPSPSPITWHSGLELLPQMLRNFGNWQEVIPGFFNLTLAGAILAVGYQRTHTLYFSIGLHAGWIFWRTAYAALTAGSADMNVWWGTSRLIDGWAAVPVLVVALLVTVRWPQGKSEVRCVP